MRTETGVFRSEKVALQKMRVAYKQSGINRARKFRDRIVFEMREIRLAGPTTPAWPAKGNFSESGRLQSRSGRLRASVIGTGIRGTQTSPRGRSVSVTVSVKVGDGVPYAAIHEHGGVIRARSAPFLVFPIIGRNGRRQLVQVKKVRIPARMGFRFTFRKNIRQLRNEMKADMAKITALGRAG